jgi:hypothetical protein
VSEEIPRPVIDAVLDYVNAGQSVDIREVVRAQQKNLLTAAADRFLERLIAQHRDDPESVRYLRSRRHLLSRCRERGIDEAFSDETDDRISQVVLEFVNTRDMAELLKYVEAHSKELLSDNTEAVLHTMAEQYRDDEAIGGFLKERIELLRECRRKSGFRRLSYEIAFSEYAMALGYELLKQDLNMPADDLLYEVRSSLNRVAASAAPLYR